MKYLIVLLGPTGVGKTDLSIEIAQWLDTLIISSDSRQVYKELKIGTAVPNETQIESVKHYMIGNKSIFDYYNASMYEFEVIDLLHRIYQKKNTALLVGGSGFYIDAVCRGIDDLPTIDQEIRQSLLKRLKEEGIESLRFDLKRLDPKYYAQTDLKNPKRILKALEVCIMTGKPYSAFRTGIPKNREFISLKIGLNRERKELYSRIEKRVDQMLEAGLEQEARHFYSHKKLNSLNTVGYKELFGYFDGRYSYDKAIELIKRNTRRYAKRQLSWFHRDKSIRWFHPAENKQIKQYIAEKTKVVV